MQRSAPARPSVRRRLALVLVQEREVRLRRADAVLLVPEAVALVGEEHVLDRDAVLADRGGDLLALRLEHARVVLALDDEQGPPDLRGVDQRRARLQARPVGGGIAELGVERVAELGPPGRDALERADPVRDAEDVDADVERVRREGERGANHVAAVAAADDADALAVDPVERLEPAARVDAVLQVDLADEVALLGGRVAVDKTRVPSRTRPS